ncbi:MAG: DNA polymerase/3'-5' exonuclease PolX [Planctomycetota bacterium]|nr:MAG: DNA polymerase/3'-5' exonuclease PolX [Planctomycetota bacterium]
MTAEQIADILDEMGTLLEIRGENPFRCRSYHNAAASLKTVTGNLATMVADGTLREISGIGASMMTKIAQLATSGQCPEYEALKVELPTGLLDLMRVPGLGAKKIKLLRETLSISSVADLRKAATAGQIADIKGFGAKTQAKILQGLDFLDTAGARMLQNTARKIVAPILKAVSGHPDVIRSSLCGSLRRSAETIGDLDILVSTDRPIEFLADMAARPEVVSVIAHGETKLSVRLSQGAQCDIRAVTDPQFPFALNYFTGSKSHNIAMRKRAIARGLKLSEYGLDHEDGTPTVCHDEADIYKVLGLAFIPPELREDTGEFLLAESGSIPKLMEINDLTGCFHNHTDWSDGDHSLEQMADASMKKGWAYLGISDHSRAAAYAGGLSIEKVHQQWARIDRLNLSYEGKFRIFKGIECDILVDGSMDYPDEVLAGFDFVVASIHSGFGLDLEAQTQRLIKAAENRYVTMLGHPTGRLLLARPGYPVDLDAVILACARTQTMIEINASPYRLDLDSTFCRLAAQRGVMISINPDAHAVNGLNDVNYGVGVARRAGLSANQVLNTFCIQDVSKMLLRKQSPE